MEWISALLRTVLKLMHGIRLLLLVPEVVGPGYPQPPPKLLLVSLVLGDGLAVSALRDTCGILNPAGVCGGLN